MCRKRVVCSCVPHGAVREYQRDDVRPQIVEYVPAVGATTNTLPGLQRSVQHVVPMCPATLHTMRPVRQPRPIRPIYNMPPRWRGQRCSVVLRTITRKVLSPTRLPCSCFPHARLGPLGLQVLFFKQFAAAHGRYFYVSYCFVFVQVSLLRPMGLNVLGY